MQDYNNLSPEDKGLVDIQMEEDGVYNIEAVKSGQHCCFCYQPEHNCLCSHED